MLTQNELKRRIALERRIARTIVTDALAAGFSLNINNGGDDYELPEPVQDRTTILKHMFLTDEEHLQVFNPSNGKQIGWVFFVYGNDGWDVVNDYSVNMEPIMQNANKIADRYS